MSEQEIEPAVRRTVAIAALRHLRAMVDADAAREATAARWARRLTCSLVLAALLAGAWLAFR